MNILITQPEFYSEESLASLRALGNVDCQQVNSNEQLSVLINERHHDMVFIELGMNIDEQFIKHHPTLRLIATPTTGLTHIDMRACEESNVTVVSLRNRVDFLRRITSTAEHIWFLLLSLARQSQEVQARISAGKWNRKGVVITQLSGKNLGIIGYGRLGEIVSGYGLSFRMNVLVYDIKNLDEEVLPRGCTKVDTLNALLSESDYIVLTASYHGNKLLNGENLPLIKPGASLINASRGELVDENDILKLLDSGILAGYATDVLDADSSWDSDTSIQNPLFEKAKNDRRIVITPHIGGYAVEAILSTRKYLVELVHETLSS